MPFCKDCGQKFTADVNFCPNCGASVISQVAPEPISVSRPAAPFPLK
ncbi:MAG: hypothetical protein V1915_02345 [Candidatus Bathyarchaeota archaeon]